MQVMTDNILLYSAKYIVPDKPGEKTSKSLANVAAVTDGDPSAESSRETAQETA